MDQQVCPLGDRRGSVRRPRVTGVYERSPRTRLTDDLFGLYDRTVLEFDGVAGVESLELRSDRDADFLRAFAIESPLAFVLDERKSDRSGVVVCLETPNLVLGSIQRDVPVPDFVEPDPEGGTSGGGFEERSNVIPGSPGRMDRERCLPFVEIHRLNQSRETERVIAV